MKAISLPKRQFFLRTKNSAKMHYNWKKGENAAQKEVQYCPKFPWGETEKTEPEKNSPKRFAAVALNVEQSPRGQLVGI